MSRLDDIPDDRHECPECERPVSFRTRTDGYEYWHGQDAGGVFFILHHRLLAVAEYGLDVVRGADVHHGKENASRLPPVEIPWTNWRENIEVMGKSEHASHHNPRTSKEALFGELQRLERPDGAPPTREQMNAEGAYDSSTYRRAFGKWTDALEAAGYDYRRVSDRVPTEELLSEMERLSSGDDWPVAEDMDKNGRFGVTTYQRRFGSWSAAKKAAQRNRGDVVD